MICSFFGHRFIGKDISANLKEVLIDLIENKGVTAFYVGHQGGFDAMVRAELKKIVPNYSNVKYFVALAYLPKKRNKFIQKRRLTFGDISQESRSRFFCYIQYN